MPKRGIPFVGEAYAVASSAVSSQECINLYPQIEKDGKTVAALYGTPGLTVFGTYGDGPIRMSHVMGVFLYVLSGNTLFEIDSVGNGVNKGTVNSSNGDVFYDDNGTQLCFVIPGDNQSWIYTISGGLIQITDPDFSTASTVTFIDSYFVFSRKNSAQFHISAVNDGTSYNALDFATAESDPDLLVSAVKINDQLWLFGEISTERWHNTGNSAFTFEKIIGATMDRGCAAAGSIVRMDNSVIWLGDDGIFYRSAEAPMRISTHAIETSISEYLKIDDARAYTYIDRGHTFYIITFPTQDITWVYDVSTQMWHRRQSDGVGRHFGNEYATFRRNQLVGSFSTGIVYEYDNSVYTDDGATILRTRIAKPIFSDTRRMFMPELQVDFETGVGLTVGQGSDPMAMLSWSDDQGKTWSNEVWASIGKKGNGLIRARWTRLGQFRQRIFKLTISDPIKVVIPGSFADIRVME